MLYQFYTIGLKKCKYTINKYIVKLPLKKYFMQIADEFWKKWNFPNCVGTTDCKHIGPEKSGYLFFNYKIVQCLHWKKNYKEYVCNV